MQKIDYKKSLKHLYKPSAKQVEFIEIPTLNYITVTGKGKPEGEEYQLALHALYPVAYKTKFWMKQHKNFDYVVPPLEGLWWADDFSDFENNNRDEWQWTMMIMQPESVSADTVASVINTIANKKDAPKALNKVTFETINEGKCAQILHLGPFSEEGPVIQKVHNAIAQSGGHLAGKHHEIYLSDIRRVTPDKYRTVIRQPMK
ncbi:GyrI-like domain-containing protein [Glaciecola sp. 1036]|uniref:GyrI-like domain-containing protein n=1 Tax=Alteromonadaceae TaxID=72275 RepID=UPI003CFCC568